jgi:uncharacterized membrane protein
MASSTKAVEAVIYVVLAAVCILLVLFAVAGVKGPPRYILALVFVLFIPGWVAVGFWAGLPREARFPVTVGASIALCIASATAGVVLDGHHLMLVFYVLAVPSALILFIRALWTRQSLRSNG